MFNFEKLEVLAKVDDLRTLSMSNALSRRGAFWTYKPNAARSGSIRSTPRFIELATRLTLRSYLSAHIAKARLLRKRFSVTTATLKNSVEC